MKISVVILTKNEEEKIINCLKSVNWADEVVVVDDYSEDGTIKKIENYKSKIKKNTFSLKIYKKHLRADFAAQRNFGLEQTNNEWVLFVDADEIVSKELKAELLRHIKLGFHKQAYRIRRVDYLWGRELKHGEVKNIQLIRLARKDAGRWKRAVHEYWNISSTNSGQVGALNNPLLHYPHKNVAQFIETVGKYSLIHAQVLEKDSVKANLFQITAYPVGKFLVNYIFKLGFLDGTPGFVHAMIMSFHSFLARSQLWLWQRKNFKVTL